ncbi:MAG: winged helix-turn-helix domain-containing protein [Candidatus Omnitrophica bacterium]|nr:winged helix-turn-helix domain-containing protein [Candidatus Omnitrophota bacterium]
MITEIGIVAGEIWHYLDDKKSSTLKEIVSTIGRDREITLMSLGWLAREGHVILEKQGDNYTITLRF